MGLQACLVFTGVSVLVVSFAATFWDLCGFSSLIGEGSHVMWRAVIRWGLVGAFGWSLAICGTIGPVAPWLDFFWNEFDFDFS